MCTSDSIVIIPTYNEKENIEKIIRAVFALEKCFHILVIDDGSPDGTAAIVRSMIATTMSTSSRWTLTSATTPMTCHGFMPPVTTKATM